jgi:DNA-binding response OmpR family regulator
LGSLKKIVESRIDNGDYLHFGEGRLAFIGGRCVKLTEIEYALAALLVERGDFISREEILEKIWGGEADPGIINVYIHYLRGKLETGGERVIISSRLRGYSINPKFLKGGKDHAEAY